MWASREELLNSANKRLKMGFFLFIYIFLLYRKSTDVTSVSNEERDSNA